MSNYKSETFLDAQLAFAKSKQGKQQKRKESTSYRYYQIKYSSKRVQDMNSNGGKNETD